MQPRANGRFASIPLLERIESKINKSGDCWVWTGALTHGYGNIFVGGHCRKAHRVYYELIKGEVPSGLELDHLCRNRACVNPDHLEPVTRQVNAQRGKPGQKQEYCKQGHKLTPDNCHYSVYKGKQFRQCKTCSLQRHRDRYWASKLKINTKESLKGGDV